jgi:hypothetical protein
MQPTPQQPQQMPVEPKAKEEEFGSSQTLGLTGEIKLQRDKLF